MVFSAPAPPVSASLSPRTALSPGQTPAPRFQWLWLPAIFALGLSIRLYQLAEPSIWWDEGYSIRLARQPIVGILVESVQADCSPPLYHLLLHGWMRLLGSGEGAVRLLSVLLGMGSILLIYRLGRLLVDERAGLAAALLMALSALQVQYSQEARAYSLMVFLSLWSTLGYARLLLQDRPSTRAGYFLVTLLLLYTHVYGLFLLLAQNLHYLATSLWRRRARTGVMQPSITMPRWPIWIALQATLGLLLAPLAVLIFLRTRDLQAGFWIAPPTLGTLRETLVLFGGSAPALVLLAALAVAGLAARSDRSRRNGTEDGLTASDSHRFVSLYLPLWLVVPVAVPVVVSLLATPIFVPRYAIACSCALYLLAARGLAALPGRAAAPLALTALSVLCFWNVVRYHRTLEKEPWRQVVSYVESHALPGDALLYDRAEVYRDLFTYYARRSDLAHYAAQGDIAQEYGELLRLAQPHPRVWLILCRSEDHTFLVRSGLQRTHRTVQSIDAWKHRGIQVLLFSHD